MDQKNLSSQSSRKSAKKHSEVARHPVLQAFDQLRDLGWTLAPISVRYRVVRGSTIMKLTTETMEHDFRVTDDNGAPLRADDPDWFIGSYKVIYDRAVFKITQNTCELLKPAELGWTKRYPKTEEAEERDAFRWQALLVGAELYVRDRELPQEATFNVVWIHDVAWIHGQSRIQTGYAVTVTPHRGYMPDSRQRVYDLEPSFELVHESYNNR
jgi:hypothetical protein